jgi:integrase
MSIVKLQPFASVGESILPPEYEYDLGKGYIEPSYEHIISWQDGIVLSRYGDDVWDLTPYGRSVTNINFDLIMDSFIRSEAKRLLYLYMSHGNGRSKIMPGAKAIENVYNSCVKPISKYAQEKNQSIENILANKRLFKFFIIQQGRSALATTKRIHSLITLLKNVSAERTGFKYSACKKNEKLLRVLIKKYTDSLQQTLLIPVSIYASAAKSRWKHIDFVEKHLKYIVPFLSEIIKYKGFGFSNSDKLSKEDQLYYVPWSEAIRKYKLEKLCKKYAIRHRQDFYGFINSLQGTCRHLIHQYTGMRESECATLTYDCWKEKTSEMPSRIFGYESKIHGVMTPQVWITHDEIKRVIDLLNAVGQPMYEKYCSHLKVCPLMIRTSYFTGKTKGARSYIKTVPARLQSQKSSNNAELPLDIAGITLTKEHIEEELMAVEPNRLWEDHEWIADGVQWKFSSHQYRRSLAVYALGSGLVSLFAIREQFGHLLNAMTAYYGNGYKSARRLDGRTDNSKHIANYMRRNRHIIQAHSFIKNVLISKTQLFGVNGLHLDKHVIAKTPEERQVVMQNLNKIVQKFRKGILHYQDTPMGGCTTPYECNEFLLPDFFIHCKGCEDSIHKLSKIERLAEKQHMNAMKWAELAPDSINHRTAVKRSVAINEFRDLLRRKKAKYEE